MQETVFENGARLVDFNKSGSTAVQATNFQVHWVAGGATAVIDSQAEIFVLFLLSAGAVSGPYGRVEAAKGQVALLPAGRYDIVAADAPVAVFTTDEAGLDAANDRDPRVAPIGAPFARRAKLDAPQVWTLDAMDFPPGNPRIKFLQSATMSINLVAYDGARTRTALSPHAHSDLEQATLTLAGHYEHHLRVPWGPNADLWLDDNHLAVEGTTVVIIPPDLIHTTEGVNDEKHILIDIFAPPRRDFIAKGWVANAADYQDPLA